MNKTKKGLTIEQLLEGIALMFSGDEDDLIPCKSLSLICSRTCALLRGSQYLLLSF